MVITNTEKVGFNLIYIILLCKLIIKKMKWTIINYESTSSIVVVIKLLFSL